MKKLSYVLFLSLLGNWAMAQCTVNANAVVGITLQCDISQGQANRSAVAYNPDFDLYYSVDAGSTGYPIETFDGAGTPLADIAQGFDYRGMWWNPNTNRLEGNGYGSEGVAYQNLNIADGYPLGTVTNIFSSAQPDAQSDGDYDYDDDEIVYYYNEAYHRYDGTTNASLGTVTITGLPVTTGNLNSNSAFYTGCPGQEYGVYDYVNKAFYFINKATGAYVATSQLPGTAPAASQFQASYANGKLWLFNGTDFNWYSYEVLQPCTPPVATITPTDTVIAGCLPGSTTLTANAGTGFTYQWQESGIDIAGATAQTYDATATGNYSVVVTENLCSQESDVTTVLYGSPTTVNLSPNMPIEVCADEVPVTIYSNTNSGQTLQWYKDNIAIPGATGSDIDITTSGYYSIGVTVNGCEGFSGIQATVNPLPAPVIVQNGNVLSTTIPYDWYAWEVDGIVVGYQATLFAPQQGIVKVSVQDYSTMCWGESAAFTPVSVANIILTELSVYPNPNNGTFLIKGHVSSQSNKAGIRITDITGRTIREEEIQVRNNTIEKQMNLSQLSAGTYMLFITCDNERQVVPLTIN